jgi:flagella basal body P-ring formation protein FlgA
MLGCLPSEAPAGSIRVWPSAVVVDEQVRLADLCELRGFSLDEEAKLRDLIITEAPAQGGSRIIHAEVIRKTLAAAGTNTALVTLGGAVECAISRPAALAPAAAAAPNRTPGTAVSAPTTDGAGSSAVRETPSPDLRRILIDYFNNELTRYGGTAEVSFDRSAEQILSLSGPQYQFDIRRRAGQALGTVALEIDVLANGSRLQTAPLVVQVAMRREVVVARRTVNQGATVSKSDVELLCLTFNRVDEPGMNELAEAIGQRAKRVIPAGTYLVPDLLEKVPLVLRGQLVTLSSVEGSIAVVTTAKAMADAHLGEVIKVRSVDDSHVEMDAIVTGPGEVKVGRITQTAGPSMLARGGDR